MSCSRRPPALPTSSSGYEPKRLCWTETFLWVGFYSLFVTIGFSLGWVMHG